MNTFKVAITGASGFIGSHLRARFKDYIAISREDTSEDILKKLEGVKVAINLAGAPIIKRWSTSYKKLLEESRINTTRKFVSAINESDVELFISTSAIGIYPDGKECDESCQEFSKDFLGVLAKKWEKEAQKCQKKTAILRLGVVLGKEGGALSQMLLPFKLGLGGPIGNGRMFVSWIDIADLMRIYDFLIKNSLSGVFNAVSPNPVTNKKFTKALAKALNRPAFIPVPIFLLKILYGEAASVLTSSKIVYPKRLLQKGFIFKYSSIDTCLNHILKG